MAKALNYHSNVQTPLLWCVPNIFPLCSLVYKIIALKDTAGMRAGDVQWRQKNIASRGESLFWADGQGGLGSWGTRTPVGQVEQGHQGEKGNKKCNVRRGSLASPTGLYSSAFWEGMKLGCWGGPPI